MSIKPKARNKNCVKELILNSEGIGRAEIAEKSELDIRTATAYAEELCRQGIAVEEKINPSGRGRPSTLYRPNVRNLRFAGFVFRTNIIEAVLSDYEGNILKKDLLDINLENEAKLTVVNRVISLVNSYINFSESGKLIAIGFALTRWLQPPLSQIDMYHDLPDIISDLTGVPSFCKLPVDVCTYHLKSIYPEMKNIIIVHPLGKVLELGLQFDGLVPHDALKHEYSFYHTSVNENGPKCYCGKNGCLGNYVTLGALLEDYRHRSGKTCTYQELLELLRANDPIAVEASSHMLDMLAVGLKKLAGRYPADFINLIGMDQEFIEMLRKKNTDIKIDNITIDNVALAAARMAAFISVINFKK